MEEAGQGLALCSTRGSEARRMGLQLATIITLCAMAVPNPDASSEPAARNWGISGLVTGSMMPSNAESSQSSVGMAFAVGGYFNLSETFAVFGSIRADQKLTASFDSVDPTPRRFYARDLNLGVSATYVEPASQIKLIGRLSADLPTSELSRTKGLVVAPTVGLSALKTFTNVGVGDFRLRATTDFRTNIGKGQGAAELSSLGDSTPLNEAYSLRTTGIGTYAFDNGLSVSAGLAWIRARFRPQRVDVWLDTTIMGVELGYKVTDIVRLAGGYSAITTGAYRDSNTQRLQPPYFFTDIHASSDRRFYLSLAATY